MQQYGGEYTLLYKEATQSLSTFGNFDQTHLKPKKLKIENFHNNI